MTKHLQNMEAVISGIKCGLFIICGTLITRIPLNLSAVSITEETTVELKTVCAVGVFGCTIVWWLSKKFQNIEDRLETLERKRTHKNKEEE